MVIGYVGFSKSDPESRFEVVEVIDSKIVRVRFLGTGSEVLCQKGAAVDGRVKDPLRPSIYGVGFTGVGKYKRSIKGVKTGAGTKWESMLSRCYSGKYKNYSKYNVCDEWHNFQNFAGWFYAKRKEGLELDKDLRFNGSYEYGPETCSFLTKSENIKISSEKSFDIVHLDGMRYTGKNIAELSRESGINKNSLYSLIRGERNMIKGWKVYGK
jgi:hypothetical protein